MAGGDVKRFIHDDFLLQTKEAKALFHEFARDLPIIDYHCHLSPEEIESDRPFESITSLWLGGDHYKWRALRANGIPEEYITGGATDWEKFGAWAATVPKLLGNPLYHWTHLELARYFGIDDMLLSSDTARRIFDRCNEIIADPSFTPCSLVRRMKVAAVCTTDDPGDSLEHHRRFAERKEGFLLYPAWRPDGALRADDPIVLNRWIDRVAANVGTEINSIEDLKEVLTARQDFFHRWGCRIADHGIDTFYAGEPSWEAAAAVFLKVRRGGRAHGEEINRYRSTMLNFLCGLNHRREWAQQFHVGVFRNVNTRAYGSIGPDSGFDTVGDISWGASMAKFFDRLDRDGTLARSIVYPVNPGDFELTAAMMGSFQDGTMPGKMQFGSAWWFMDQKDGMERQMRTLANLGLLSRFVGMTTDSRSFLSYPRHEYFRRILCNLLGADMADGLIPGDMKLAGNLVRDICYKNARDYFALPGLQV